MAKARQGIVPFRALALMLALAVASGGALLPLRPLQWVGTAQAQEEDDASDEDEVDGEEDAGDEDVGEEDAGEEDAGEEDAGEEDAGEEDAGEEDAGEEDAGEEDAGEEDAGEEDAGEEDAGEEDAGEEDAGEEDADEEDADEEVAAEGDADESADEWSDDVFVDELDAEEGNDFSDDDWAGEFEAFDDAVEADDAIPVDAQTWGDDVEWEVSEVVVDDEDADALDADEDSVGAGGMLVLSKSSRRSAASGGGRPATRPGTSRPAQPPARPGTRPSKDDDEDTPYAYGGRPVSALAVPWQAQIFNPKVQPDPKNPKPVWQRSHVCGGALIAKDWVLTAAHCIDQELVDYGFKVRLGVTDISKGDGITYRIDRIVRHSRYLDKVEGVPAPPNPPNMYHDDIALIRIAEDGAPKRRDPKKIREIPLNRQPLAGGTPVSVTGWGAVGAGDTQAASAAILRVDLRLMDTPVCQRRPKYGPEKIHDKVFCAAHPTRSTCRGDSGGPVVLTNGAPVLVGLVSWGKKVCAGDGRPGVYTRIDRYLAWIEQAMKLPPGRNALP